MIIKDKISMLRKGYPTVSDKYNVAGGILQSGSADVPFGALVAYGSQVGYYAAATSVAAIGDIAGVVLATNVKLSGVWPDEGSTSVVKPKEAFNLMLDGYVAIELDNSVPTSEDVLPMIAAVGAASTDTAVNAAKDYYTRASSSAGAGYLNDGTYAYTKVASPTGNPSTSSYYELSVVGQDAVVNLVTPGKQAAVILATGKLTTVDAVAAGIVAMPGYYYTGIVDGRLAEVEIRR